MPSKSRPLIDTGEQKVIDDAVKLASFSEMEIKQMATDACEEFHEKRCPAKDLGGKLDKFVGEFIDFRADIRAQLATTEKLLRVGIAGAFVLVVTLVGATWAIADRTRPEKHSSWSVISSAHASTIDAAK